MAELQAACRLTWKDAAPAQAALRLEWKDAATVQSIGSPYARPSEAGAPVSLIGGLAPRIDIVEQPSYGYTHTWGMVDLRTDPPTPLVVRTATLDLSDLSALWTLRAEGAASLYAALTTGDQPPVVRLTIGAQAWSFVVETIDAPQAFASSAVSFGGRSIAALADAPYTAPEQWTTDAPTTAAQLATIANTFTGVSVAWRAPDWLIPAGAWSFNGSPFAVVGQVAQAIGAVVEAARDTLGVTVTSRYPVLPNKWATTPPDWQVHWNAVERSNFERADTPEFNAVYVAGQQQGGLLLARYAGTSGAVQAPMVTDPLLTDLPGLQERATTVLSAYGKQARVSRTLQVGADGVVERGALMRFVDPGETWVGMVRSVSVAAAFGKVRQTLGLERRTAFQAGLYVPPLPIVPPSDPYYPETVLLLPFDGDFDDKSVNSFVPSVLSGAVIDSDLQNVTFGSGCGKFLPSNSFDFPCITFAASPALRISGPFTIQMRWTPMTAQAGTYCFSLGNATGGYCWFCTDGAGKIAFHALSNQASSNVTAQAGVTYYLAITRDAAGIIRFYIDSNKFYQTSPGSGTADSLVNSSVQIGTAPIVSGYYPGSNGACYIDDLRVLIGACQHTEDTIVIPARAFPLFAL